MKFWDASALAAFLFMESRTAAILEILKEDPGVVIWWGTTVECASFLARLRRDGFLRTGDEDRLRGILLELASVWSEMAPGNEVRDIARRLLLNHPLKAADSLQLAAALVWSGKNPQGHHFVCLDQRLRTAARNEGFRVLPVTT